ncbi:MAG: T9SS type A sorting domain-containing protein [Crocinitomicaceae bacterium]|nr:T9SS type A sorting domain-containing protein [Crocinitomicaceae bacterium]
MKSLFLLIGIVAFCTGQSQVYLQKSYVTPHISHGSDIRLLSDDGYIIAGLHNSASTATAGYHVLRLNELGDTLWTRIFKTENIWSHPRIIPVNAGGFLMAGSYSFGGLAIFRLNDLGDTLWTKTFTVGGGGEMPVPIETADGGFAIGGQQAWQTYLVRLDSDGNILWDHRYSGVGGFISEHVEPRADLIVEPDGSFVLAGCTRSAGMDEGNGVVIKTDANGVVTWLTIVGGSGQDDFKGITSLANGDYAAVGYSGSFGGSGAKVFLTRFDSLGTVLWSKTYDANLDDMGYSVLERVNGDLTICGSTGPFYSTDFYGILFSTDSLGNLIWSQKYSEHSGFKSADFTPEGGYALTGYVIDASSPQGSTVFIKANELGKWDCNTQALTLTTVQQTPLISNTFNTFSGTALTNYLLEIQPPDFTDNLICKAWQTGITEQDLTESGFSVYPMPADQNIVIMLHENHQPVKRIEVYNSTGQIVYSADEVANQENTIDTSSYPDGIYLLGITLANDEVQFQKVVVQH